MQKNNNKSPIENHLDVGKGESVANLCCLHQAGLSRTYQRRPGAFWAK